MNGGGGGSEHDARARQARVRTMMEAGVSVMPDSHVPDISHTHTHTHTAATAPAGGGGSGNASRDASQHHPYRSPSHSRQGSGGAKGAAATQADGLGGGGGGGGGGGIGEGLKFQKETVGSAPVESSAAVSSGLGSGVRSMQASTLAQQLQLARSGLDSSLPRSASMAICKYTVYLPHEEGSMVQIATASNCTAHELVKEALRAAVEEMGGGELPVGLLADPWAYRVYVAEEDGEVDTDFPSLDARMNVASLGVESFVLRDRVDAAVPAAGADGAGGGGSGGGRPASGSTVQEGQGEDHSSNNRGGGFKSLETEAELEDQASRKADMEAQRTCCSKCVVQ